MAFVLSNKTDGGLKKGGVKPFSLRSWDYEGHRERDSILNSIYDTMLALSGGTRNVRGGEVSERDGEKRKEKKEKA